MRGRSGGRAGWGRLVVLLTALPASSAATAPVAADEIEREFVRRGSAIVKALQEKGVKSVGVLKFRIQKGNEPASDSVGTLNAFLADRLEVALILKNDNDSNRQLQVIKGASAVAATIPGANHTTAGGREKLFAGRYKLAWGNASDLEADAFVTGVVRVQPDLKQMTVGLFVYRRGGEKEELLIPVFRAPTDANVLNELGESFVLRGAFDKGTIELAEAQSQAVNEAAKVKSSAAAHPLQDPACPVSLSVAYDGRPVPIEFRDGAAHIAEPKEGQAVVLTLRRTAAAKDRLAVVLKVNGENTLFRERQRDLDCRKWILEPGAAPIVIRGYQKSDAQIEKFRILSDAESTKAELNYGADVGLISLVVFREQDKNKPPPTDLPTDEAEDLAALLRGVQPEAPPKNLNALRAQLRETGLRGLIGEGAAEEGAIRRVTFTADPTPAVSAVIRYRGAR